MLQVALVLNSLLLATGLHISIYTRMSIIISCLEINFIIHELDSKITNKLFFN